MKKVTTLILILVATISFAQENKQEYPQDINVKQELKVNAFSLIALSSLDFSYEYLLNKDSSFGVDLFLNFSDNYDDIGFPRKFSLTPYYRWFFSERLATRGFFVEAFGMLNTQESDHYDYYYDSNGYYTSSYNGTKTTDFALGISVGGKFITRKRFVAEIYLGLGRNIFNNQNDIYDTNIVSRGGISLGYRF